MARPRSVVAIWRSAGASWRICSQHSKNMRRPEAPTGWPNDFNPPSGLIGRSPSRSNVPARTSFHAVPRGCEAQVLHQHELGRREAVVHLRHGQLPAGIGDARLRVGVGRRGLALGEVGVVVARVDEARSAARREGERLDVDRLVRVPQRVLGAHHDGRRRAVRHTGTIEHAEGARQARRPEHGLLGDLAAELGPRVPRAVVVVLHRDGGQDVGHRLVVHPVLLPVGRSHHGEHRRGRQRPGRAVARRVHRR